MNNRLSNTSVRLIKTMSLLKALLLK